MRQYKYFMLYCKADDLHSTKYSLECLYQFLLISSVLSQRDRERFIWNRSVKPAESATMTKISYFLFGIFKRKYNVYDQKKLI